MRSTSVGIFGWIVVSVGIWAVAAEPAREINVWPGKPPGETLEVGPEVIQPPKAGENPPTTRITNIHAFNDGVTCKSSVRLFLELKKAGVASELHVYATGGHGFGLRPSQHACSTWPKRCEEWFASRGLLNK